MKTDARDPICEDCGKRLTALPDYSGEERAAIVCFVCEPPTILCRACAARHIRCRPFVPLISTTGANPQ